MSVDTIDVIKIPDKILLNLKKFLIMIELYTFTTPNGRKPAIMLEEVGLPYTVHKVDITKGEQFKPEYVAINPNSKIPAIVDTETEITVFESGAILIYLAEKTGQFLPTEAKKRYQVMEWLMFQMASIGPMFGQLGHFKRSASEKIAYAINRYETETLRLFKVLNRQLETHEFIAGAYSIADMATYPWIVSANDYLGITVDEHPHLKRWSENLQKRSAVQKGMAILNS
ncbi:Glutathione S-transferase domain protein [Gloeothece citriformis PCC 7424]|uniref:Glutathione S-transferase domain protein n=1 Tax=Gloeothece citriformis (strain PCC 7424) TaxID=65393 RepID=B7KH78_GLOC7|nr:glutathione S-transferase N-terminal domain-containing protein [Gloeothece citriformis]ACK69287.1 Glutathione S-transferase domain protein [Gloeothece citriformis PCC 7424]